jgi:hypothetical protein
MEPGSQRITTRSWHVIARFCLKLALFSIVCGFQVASGGPNLFFDMTVLAALLCAILAVRARERPVAKSLNYWDEALVFGLISQIGSAFLGMA